MKLKFKKQEFQDNAVMSVVDLFKGCASAPSTFSVEKMDIVDLSQDELLGYANNLDLSMEQIQENLKKVQDRNLLPLTDLQELRFNIEMETGTGKTFVYTKTILELHKQYGFNKFVIVVPSVAIREGVYKSMQTTRDYFKQEYEGVCVKPFIYNSAKRHEVRDFALSNNLEAMIVNIDAFKKNENLFNQTSDTMIKSAKEFLRECRPIIIIDEPQSVDNTAKAREAITSLNPLFELRYSATHRQKINTVYRLTPVDAYNMHIVKQICVVNNNLVDDFNKPYIKLLEVDNKNGYTAKLELDCAGTNGAVKRVVKTVKPNSNLETITGRSIYEGYVVAGINAMEGFEEIEFTNTEFLSLGKAIGDIDELTKKREQIKRTIEAHLDKERVYIKKGIKVLSLFFIDEVAKYRDYEAEDTKGVYAKIFEECYNELIEQPKYREVKEFFNKEAEQVHDGYFSKDKKGKIKNTNGDTIDDYSTYNTIMKDKEWLLSFDCPLRFIFSHSALKEGWDNPNVFQICTLIEQKSTFTCRQKIGRGLRLCVNQDGERIEDKNINVLHVVANESFSEFAETLQKEIETETGVKFGTLQISLFSGMTYTETKTVEKTITKDQAQTVVEALKTVGAITAEGKVDTTKAEIVVPKELETVKEEVIKVIEEEKTVDVEQIAGKSYTEEVTEEKTVTYDDAQELITHFEQKGYVSKSGKIKDTMKEALLHGTLDLPKKFEAARERLESIVKKADNKLPIRDDSKEVIVRLNKQVMLSPEFMELWNKIKQKTAYRVQIDTDVLVENCVKELKAMPEIPKARLITKTASYDIRNAGVGYVETETRLEDLKDTYSSLPNILGIISEETLIKKATVAEIIQKSGRAQDFLNNPQAFMEQCLEIIRHNRHALAIDGIKYVKLDGKEYYAQEIFDSTELVANLDKNAVKVEHSVYDHIIYDSSTVEKPFAVALDKDPDVKMFFKIPDRFKIDTPIGTYNPDWAVLWERNGEQKLYFILETKGTESLFNLKTPEQLKIHCGKEHFKALANGLEMHGPVKDWDKFKINV